MRRPGFALPDGWIACGWRFEVETISPQQRSLIQQHFGARRFAYNWALATVKANLDARAADPSVPLLAWTLPTLRKAWNQAKVTVAPWWPSCSVAGGQARVLSMTLSEHAGRLFVSVASIIILVARSPREPHARCGIDLGVGTEWAVIAHADGTVERIPHPIQWASVQKQHRRLARRASRRTVGSRGHREAKTKLAALDRRAANLRRESIHTLTTRLTRRYGTIVVEDLDIAAMARGMGRRAFRRSVHAAGLGQIRPTMAYKSAWRGCTLVVADRWFASSKIHHQCGGYHPDLKLADRRWVCPRCGGLVDRNANAARNLRDWTGPVTDRDVQRGGVAAPVPIVGDHDGQAHAAAWACEASEDHRAVAEADDTRTEPHPGARNPAQGCQERSDTDAR